MKNFTKRKSPLSNLKISSIIAAFIFLIISGNNSLKAQSTTLTIGTSTSTTSNLPYYSYYPSGTYSQQIFLQSEIMSAGGYPAGGTIDTIRLYYSSGNYASSATWEVYLGHTTKTKFNDNFDWVPYANLTQVYTGAINFPAAGNWVDIPVSVPFPYNGLENLVVAINQSQPSYTYNYTYWRYSSTSDEKALRYYSYSGTSAQNPATSGFYNTRYSYRNNMQFSMNQYPACTGVPTAGNTIADTNAICMGTTTNLSIQNSFAGTSEITYQWQINDMVNGWTDISGDTFSTATTEPLFTTTAFRCVVSCNASNLSDTSAPITVQTITPDSVNVTPDAYAFCPGSSVSLTAVNNGPVNYNWSPSTGLSSTTGATVSANPAQATTYTVESIDTNNCITTATAFVSPVTDVSAKVSSVPSNICAAGSTVTLEMNDYPTALSGSASWEFQWKDTSGAVVMPWSAFGYLYGFTPPTDGVYEYTVDMRSSACPLDSISNPVSAKVVVGFGADVDTTQVNCLNPTGSLELYNAFGQTSTDTSLQLDFSNGSNSNVNLFGSAVYEGNKIACTPSATGVSGGFLFNHPSTSSSSNAFTINFDLTVDQPINNYGTGGADGVCYSFADDINTTSYNHNGTGSKLRLCFDAAGNSSTNGNVVGIYLVYGWGSTTAYGPNTNEVLAFSPNTTLWKGQVDVPVQLAISNDGLATVSVGGSVIFSDVLLPASFLNEDLSTWQHTFTAATGGDAERHAISDITIVSGALQYGITAGANNMSEPTVWQASSTFSGLTPGFYHLWMSNPSDANCNKDLGVFEVKNNYPVVDLGNDTTICDGDSVLLDAGVGMNAYLWSENNWTLQTLTVTEEGTYSVSVTDSVGCSAMASIDVEIADAPTADYVFASGNGYDYTFFVVNPANVGTYDWYFGDNNQLLNGGVSTNHTYGDTGTYDVTVFLNSEYGCGIDSINQSVRVSYAVGIEDLNETDIQIYPNPATNLVVFDLGESNIKTISIHTLSGQLIENKEVSNQKQIRMDVSNWNNGVYILNLVSEQKASEVYRLIVNH